MKNALALLAVILACHHGSNYTGGWTSKMSTAPDAYRALGQPWPPVKAQPVYRREQPVKVIYIIIYRDKPTQ